jgi:Ca2+-binding RTX toxin-like protein
VLRFVKIGAIGAACVVTPAACVFTFGFPGFGHHHPTPYLPLSSGSGFTITTNIYSSPACSGSTALLDPGVTRCLIYTVKNNLTVPITVRTINIALDPRFSAPPSGCSAADLSLPNFSGSLSVPGAGSANSSGLPIYLTDTKTNQDNCENTTLHFVYTGSAVYTDRTSTALVSSLNPSTSGRSVTFTATVTAGNAGNAGSDHSGPTGTVNFYSCTTASCGSTTLLGSGTVGSNGQATYSTASLPVGSSYLQATYEGAPSNFAASTSNVVTQVVNSTAKTATSLTSVPNPSAFNEAVVLTAGVTKSSGAGTPGGTVSFYLGTPSGTHSLLGTGTLNGSAQATLTTSALPAGTDSLYAVYGGSAAFAASTSSIISQIVISAPAQCGKGPFDHYLFGSPVVPYITGTDHNDFIYGWGGPGYVISDQGGNHCIWVGDGSNNITDGNGNDNVVAGNGTNTIVLGQGADTVTAGDGSLSHITVGNGSDSVDLGSGSHNVISLGSGTDTVTVEGSDDTIDAGAGNETIYLGSGTDNTYAGGKGHDTCHLPAPPASYKGTAATYYHDTITNCTVVSP